LAYGYNIAAVATNMPDTQHTDTRHRLINLLKQFGVAALYVLFSKITLTFFSTDGVVSLVWPSSGLALAVLLIGGRKYLWGIFLGAAIASAMTGVALIALVFIATGDVLEPLIGAWLLTRNDKLDKTLTSLHSYLLLILSGSVASFINALFGTTILLFSGFLTSEAYLTSLNRWWMGDLLGIILVAPLILICWQTRNDWRGAKRITETILLLGLTFLAGQIIFLDWFHTYIGHGAKGYVMFLFIIWVAVRLGTRGTIIALNMIAIQALLSVYRGVGYFANGAAQNQLDNYWLYLMILSVTGMALATFISGQKRSEEALRRSEMKFRTLFESTNDAVMLMNEKGFLDCNKATLEMIGFTTKEEFCSKHPADVSPPEQPCGTSSFVLANQHIAAAIKEGGRRFEWVSKRVDTGRIFIADVLLSAIELEGNLVLQVVIRDITEQKRAREEFERFFNLVPDMACIASTDGYFKKINPAWQKTLGYTEQELLSAPFLDFVHPDDRDATMGEVERQMGHLRLTRHCCSPRRATLPSVSESRWPYAKAKRC
jgi:PAS domain S-box-containing protein